MDDDASVGEQSAFSWKEYSVGPAHKAPLLKFVRDALEARGCQIKHIGPTNRAPFFIVFDMPGQERLSILVYAFLASSKITRMRPPDEHRFQIKYGGDLSAVIDVAVDPRGVTTTIFVGIDLQRNIFIAVDPSMNNPSPMSRSVEFKTQNVDEVLSHGWHAWERDRHEAKTTTRRAYELLPDIRTEVLIGGKRDRLLDLILLERVAQGLDPGERHLIADKFRELPGKPAVDKVPHELLDELSITPEALFDLINSASRLKMAVRGWVAENHLAEQLNRLKGIEDCVRLQGDGRPDISVRWRNSKPIFIECKNVLRTTYSGGIPKLDFQRTRAAKSDPCSRYYMPSDFQIVAACLHPLTEKWEFRFALTSDLPDHQTCPGRKASNIRVEEKLFSAGIDTLLDRLS